MMGAGATTYRGYRLRMYATGQTHIYALSNAGENATEFVSSAPTFDEAKQIIDAWLDAP